MVQASYFSRLSAILLFLFAVSLQAQRPKLNDVLPNGPQITTASPLTGSVGTLVTLSGSNFSDGSVVTIGGTTALTVSINATHDLMTVLVMPGSVTGSITCTNSGGSQTFTSNFTVTKTVAPNNQQGNKLIGTKSTNSQQGFAVAISADGNTAIVGGNTYQGGIGAAWVYTRSGDAWQQQGSEIVPTDYQNLPGFGSSVAISADGNTAIIGGTTDSFYVGASWIYTRSGSSWSVQTKLKESGSIGTSAKGYSVALSADGNTAVVGGNNDNSGMGASWVYSRSNGAWTTGNKLLATDNIGSAALGSAVAISANGNTILVGGNQDNSGNGAAWVYKYDITNGWIQQTKLTDNSGGTNYAGLGNAVAISADGTTAVIGGSNYNYNSGSTWMFISNSGVWSQQGNVLIGKGGTGAEQQGYSVSLSADGNVALVGGSFNKNGIGSAWTFSRNNGSWVQTSHAFTGNGLGTGIANFGSSVALSFDGTTEIIGGNNDNNSTGASWVFNYSPVIPNITRFSPDTAIPGTVDTIYASNISGVTQVTFGGVPAASFSVSVINGDSVLLATIGNGASGFVSVTNSYGVDSTAGFTFFKCYPVYSTTQKRLCADSIPYNWNNVNCDGPGTFIAHLTTVGGCDSIATLVLSQDTIPDVQITGNTIGCDSVKLSASGGGSYKWSGGASPTADSNTFKSDGNFTLTVKSGNGCSASQDFTVIINESPKPDILGSLNGCDSITLYADGGAEFKWTDGVNNVLSKTDNVKITTTGVYTLTVTDENGCVGSTTKKDTVFVSPDINIKAINGTKGCDSVTLVAFSTASKKGKFQWDGGYYDASDTNMFAFSGNYNVYVTDSVTGCTSQNKSIDIVVNYSPNISLSGEDTACNSVTFTASGGTSYSWSGGNTPTAAANTFTQSGHYGISVTGANGCSNTDTAFVVVNQSPKLSITQRFNCGDITLKAVASPSGSVKFDWGGYGHFPSYATNTFDTSGTFTYKVTATDSNGCMAADSQSVVVSHRKISLDPVVVGNTCFGTAILKASTEDSAQNVFITKDTLVNGLSIAGKITKKDSSTIVHTDASVDNLLTPTPYSPNTAGRYYATATFKSGCQVYSDVIIIKKPSTDTISAIADANYLWHGTNYTSSGNYAFDTINAIGCDSLTILKLTISTPVGNTWTGTISTDWFNAGNWTVGVPSSTTDALIPVTSVAPVIASGTANAKNISISLGTTLTNNSTLNLYGNLVDSGAIISSNTSNLVLQGSGTLSGNTTCGNLEVIGTYSVGSNAADKIAVTSILKKTSGTLSTNDKLTLVSTATASALIQDNGGVLSGKAYVQHFTSGAFGYHHFSSPISDGIVKSWERAFPLDGPDGAGAWTKQRGTLQYYDEVKNIYTVLDSGYYNYTALSNELTPGKGYTAYLNSLPTLNTFGTPNNGPISIPVTHTTGTNAPKGWNMVGNPYPSPISWKALRTLNSGLFANDDACYLWKAAGKGLDGTWSTYDGTVGVNGAGDVINSSLGFFVYVENSGTLKFDNTVRTYDFTSPEIFGTKSTASNTLRLSIKDAISGTTDEAVAYTNYKSGYSRKIAQPEGATNATIAFDVYGKKAAINVLTALDSKTELPLVISTPKAGTYTLSLNTKNIDLPVYLKDAVTGIYTDLSATTTITTTTKESTGRYSIVFSKSALFTNNNPITTFPNPAKDVITVKGNHISSIQVVDNIGRVVKVISLTDATNPTLSVSKLSAGAYHLKVQTKEGKVSLVGMVKE